MDGSFQDTTKQNAVSAPFMGKNAFSATTEKELVCFVLMGKFGIQEKTSARNVELKAVLSAKLQEFAQLVSQESTGMGNSANATPVAETVVSVLGQKNTIARAARFPCGLTGLLITSMEALVPSLGQWPTEHQAHSKAAGLATAWSVLKSAQANQSMDTKWRNSMS